MITYEKAIKIIDEKVEPLNKIVIKDITESSNYILAEDLYSDIDLPPFNKSLRDGFAVDSKKIIKKKKYFITGEIIAGDNISNIKKPANDTVYRIMTGAPVPTWADAVVQIEDTNINNDYVEFKTKVKKSQHIGYKGKDTKKNTLILKAGTNINPFLIPFLAATANLKIKVLKKPSLSIITTGNELVHPEKKISPGKIRETNSYSLKFLLNKYRLKLKYRGYTKDNKKNVMTKLKNGLKNSDLVLINGGVSMGEYDFVHLCIKEICKDILFYKIAVKPGKPCILGVTKDNKYIFGIPGNPVSTLIAFEMLIVPLIKKLSGYNKIKRDFIYAKLSKSFQKNNIRSHMIPGNIKIKNKEQYFIPNMYNNSGDVVSINNSTFIMYAPKNVTHLHKGSKVKVYITN